MQVMPDYYNGDPGCYANLGPHQGLSCPTRIKAPSEPKEQIRELSSQLPHRMPGVGAAAPDTPITRLFKKGRRRDEAPSALTFWKEGHAKAAKPY
jgi:hypothetical protein